MTEPRGDDNPMIHTRVSLHVDRGTVLDTRTVVDRRCAWVALNDTVTVFAPTGEELVQVLAELVVMVGQAVEAAADRAELEGEASAA
jgi:hypothetical protein